MPIEIVRYANGNPPFTFNTAGCDFLIVAEWGIGDAFWSSWMKYNGVSMTVCANYVHKGYYLAQPTTGNYQVTSDSVRNIECFGLRGVKQFRGVVRNLIPPGEGETEENSVSATSASGDFIVSACRNGNDPKYTHDIQTKLQNGIGYAFATGNPTHIHWTWGAVANSDLWAIVFEPSEPQAGTIWFMGGSGFGKFPTLFMGKK